MFYHNLITVLTISIWQAQATLIDFIFYILEEQENFTHLYTQENEKSISFAQDF